MIQLKSISANPLENLSLISDGIGEKFTATHGFGLTTVKSKYGDGVVSATIVSKEIAVLIFDAMFYEDIFLHMNGDSSKSIDFVFCLEGHVYHKFESNSAFIPINFRQNTIVNRKHKSKSVLKIPENVHLKMSMISYQPSKSQLKSDNFSELRLNAFKALSEVYSNSNRLYSGRICFRTSNFVKDIIKFNTESTSSVLFKEAAILNTIASQIDRHDTDAKSEHAHAPLRLYEIDKINSLETFINNNLTESLTLNRLEKISGLNPSKLQLGFKYLYGKTVSTFVTEKRLERAAKLIYDTDLNVSELVYSVGFTSRSYFSKIFKNHFGVLPSQCITNPDLLKL